MTTYTTTFSGQTTASAPTNFTDRYDSNTDVTIENPALGEEDDRVLEFGTGDSGDVFYSFDDVDGDANRDNIEVLCRFQLTGSNSREAVVRVRASGTSNSDKTCYDFYINVGSIAVVRWVSGSGSVLGSADADNVISTLAWTSSNAFNSFPPNLWAWARFRVNGTGATVTLQGKYWCDGYDEPTDWQVDTTDTSGSRITAAGWVGFAKRSFTQTAYLDYFSAGTNGDTVSVATGGAAIRATHSMAEVLVHPDNAEARVTQVNASVLYDPNAEARVTQVNASVLYSIAPSPSTGQSIQCIIMT